ncbi:MAG: RIO1 family regulatory kinase/ATPase [Aggregatilineales bacterium]
MNNDSLNLNDSNIYEDIDNHIDEYAVYEAEFNPMQDRQARRKRKKKVVHQPKKSQEELLQEIADTVGLEGGFETTYQPSQYEAGWLLNSVRVFYDMALISDVLSQVKGGKEASVYRCEAHESVEDKLFLAAKVYRPRQFRQLRNDKMYRQGRMTLGDDGKEVRDDRSVRAIGKKSAYGQQVAHTSWLMHEYKTMQMLYDAGASIPKPYAAGENAILMEYFGDDLMPAPTLNTVDLSIDEALKLFESTLKNIDILLRHGLIHGDLSAYNILYWQGDIVLIDFPQVVNIENNENAKFILHRDITRICEYFQKQGIDCDAEELMFHLWNEHVEAIHPNKLAADLSRLLEAEEYS